MFLFATGYPRSRLGFPRGQYVSPTPLCLTLPSVVFRGSHHQSTRQPFQVPINLPGSDIITPPINVIITRFNSAPTVTVTPVVVVLPQDQTSFEIGKQVTIVDPDTGDVATPYVPGSARIIYRLTITPMFQPCIRTSCRLNSVSRPMLGTS